MKWFKSLLSGLVLTLCAALVPLHAEDTRVQIVSKTINVASLADGVGETDTVTVPGAALGDACIASSGVDLAGISVTCYISAANTVSIRVQNESGGTLDLASTTWRVFVFPKGSR